MTKYLIRLDDASPYMNRKKWAKVEELLDKYDVKPLVGIIPDNHDCQTMIEKEEPLFWSKVSKWQDKGWSIAMHGYDHCYTSKKGMKGLNPMWSRSEFAGMTLEEQKEKIRRGVDLLKKKNVEPRVFFAPSHTFDENTLTALREESNIRVISDTIGRFPYKRGDFWFIPQIVGRCRNIPFSGIYTFCFHPNTMNEGSFVSSEKFLKQNKEHIIKFDDVNLSEYGDKKVLDSIISMLFFFYRRLRGFY